MKTALSLAVHKFTKYAVLSREPGISGEPFFGLNKKLRIYHKVQQISVISDTSITQLSTCFCNQHTFISARFVFLRSRVHVPLEYACVPVVNSGTHANIFMFA